jgi:2-dehydro-3-deoxyphosphogluconate aldolase/(4S)-4-hydroxy-2-oxoglutarate aldolase
MDAASIYEKIGTLGVVPMVAIDDAEKALPLADALTEGGLAVAEITFRTPAAADAIKTLADRRPELLLGAGTLLTVDDLRRARNLGAAFGVAPGLNPALVAEAKTLGFAFAPGVMTPTDIEAATALGLNVLKYFPAEVAGGPGMLKALAGPYGHTGLKFIPTGGINGRNFRDYLALDVVLAVGGSWVARCGEIADGNWQKIKANCRQIADAMA